MVKTRIKSAGASDPGRVRSNNEDALYVDADRGIFLVVDGIGGHAAGEKAAAIAVERVRARLDRPTGGVSPGGLRRGRAPLSDAPVHAPPPGPA